MKVIFNFIWDRWERLRQAPRLPLAALAVMGVALRLCLLPSALDTTDDVNFALALDRFDLAHHQPHFPGYPLYVLAARACHLVFPATLSLALPGILGSLLLVFAVTRALPNRFQSLAAAALLTFAPTLVLTSAAPGSDGLALALAGAALAWPFGGGRFAISGVLLGLALGVRASYAPLAISLLFLPPLLGRRGVIAALAGLTASCLAWAVPLAVVVGPPALLHEAALQIGGHFSSWGGSVATSTLGWGPRALVLLGQATRGLLPLVALALLLRPRLSLSLAAALTLPYALWAYLGQNPDHARHAAPLTALACVAIALAVDSPKRLATLAVGLLFCFPSLQAPTTFRKQAIENVRARLGVERVMIAGTHLPRVAHYYAPELRSAAATNGAEVEALLAGLPPGVTLVVEEVPSLSRPGLLLERFDNHLYIVSPSTKLAVQP